MVKRIVVPEGMLDAFMMALLDGVEDKELRGQSLRESWRKELTAAIKWLSENPIVPTDEQIESMMRRWQSLSSSLASSSYAQYVCQEWQRRIFLAPELVVPEELKDLLVIGSDGGTIKSPVEEHNRKIIAAFNRGKKAANR